VCAHTVGGIQLDAGAESFATRSDTVATLARELGMADLLVTPNPAGAWLHQADGRSHPLPRTGLLGIPGTPMAGDVLQIVGFAGGLRAQLDSLIPGFVGAKETSLGALVRKRMGRRVLERLVVPVVAGVHSRHPNELEADVVAPGLRQRLRGTESLAAAVLATKAAAPAGASVAGLRGGVHRLAEELRSDLELLGADLRLGCSATTIDGGGVTTSTGERIAADLAVLSSASPQDGAQITLATLVLSLPELDAAPRGTGVLVAPGTPGIAAKALTHATAKWSWLAERAGEHRHVLRLSYDGSKVTGQEPELREQARADASALLGVEIPASTIDAFAVRQWRSAATGPAVVDGVVAIGESVAGTGLAAVIAHARKAAAGVISELAESGAEQGDD
jgi:oxygen-dependent protoporphyrinogen oxidase